MRDLAEWSGDHRRNPKGAPLGGKSLKPFLENTNLQSHGLPAAITITASWSSQSPRKQNLSAVSERYRYIRYGDGSEELYDRHKDPYEWQNLASTPEMAQIIAQHSSYIDDQVPENVMAVSANAKTPSKKEEAEVWKDKYFKKHPEADTDGDGTLSWPEFKAYKKRSK